MGQSTMLSQSVDVENISFSKSEKFNILRMSTRKSHKKTPSQIAIRRKIQNSTSLGIGAVNKDKDVGTKTT